MMAQSLAGRACATGPKVAWSIEQEISALASSACASWKSVVWGRLHFATSRGSGARGTGSGEARKGQSGSSPPRRDGVGAQGSDSRVPPPQHERAGTSQRGGLFQRDARSPQRPRGGDRGGTASSSGGEQRAPLPPRGERAGRDAFAGRARDGGNFSGPRRGDGSGPHSLQRSPTLLPRAAVPAPPADLAALNAPRATLQLIGDPRSGVADDTTTSVFGEVTVEMLHHQPSNQVYWFKYAFAGGAHHGGSRDARLSDYSRNLMYLLRAADPQRWTIPALASAFRIRQQRVLAVLALKELEAQRIEDGRLLGGPLAAYGLTLRTADVHLHPATGLPLRRPAARPAGPSGGAAAKAGGGGPDAAKASAAVMGAAARVHVDAVLPRVLSNAQRLQARLLAALRPYGTDPARVARELTAELQRGAEAAAAVLGEGAPYIAAELGAYRAAVERVVAAVAAVVDASEPLVEERRAAALQSAVAKALATAAGPAAPKDAAAHASPDGAAAAASLQRLQAAFAPLLEGPDALDDAALQRAFFTLPHGGRAASLRLLPALSSRLAAGGVDLQRAGRDGEYRGPAAAAAAGVRASRAEARAHADPAAAKVAARVPRLAVDVFGWRRVPAAQLAELAAAGDALSAAAAALEAKVVALEPSLAKPGLQSAASHLPGASPGELSGLRALLRQYTGVEAMWGEAAVATAAAAARPADRRRGRPRVVEPARVRRLVQILAEADASAVRRALAVEAVQTLRHRRAYADADRLAAGAGAMAAAAAASASAADGDGAGAGARAPSWDALAAYLDVRVAGRTYARGSGERHVVRLPSFPAFEGYSLEEFDSAAREGELSALNRLVAERTESQMAARFRDDLLFNLGLRGPKLRDSDPGRPPWPPNLRTAVDRPVVLYGITPDGATQYPPLHVALGGGATRPLNEQERVLQERRVPRPRLPYYMGRIRRMPELE